MNAAEAASNKATMALAVAVLMLGSGIAHGESVHDERSSERSVSQRAKHVAMRAFDATRHGIERGAVATAHGVKRGARAAGHGVRSGAEAVGRVAHRVAEKL